ncbi:MAG: PAS domain S-box protein [Anaerolinea sp.]|nr:PAS domain S-box protein [Anaerolinea sp.]
MNRDGNDARDKWFADRSLPYYAGFFLLGALLLSVLSIWQKRLLGASVTDPKGFIVPILFGGGSGVLLGLWRRSIHVMYQRARQNDFLYRALVEQAADGIFIADAQGNYIEVNNQGCAMLGYTRAELLQMNLRDLLSPDELADVPLRLDNLYAGKTVLIQRRLICKDGSLLLVEINAKQLPDGRIQGIVRDISEREKAFASLRESQERLALVVQGANVGLWDWIVPTGELVLNEQWALMLDYTPQEITPRFETWQQLLHPDDAPAVMAALEAHLRGATPRYEAQYRLRMKSGAWKWVLDKGVVVQRDAAGVPLRALGMHVDIQESEQLKQELREHEERLRSLINATPDTICFKDGDGRWLIANDAALQLFQLEDVDYRGKTDAELAGFSPFYREAFLTCQQTDEVAWQGAPLSRGDEVIPRPDGSCKVYDVIKAPLFDDDGRRKGLVVLGRDITERKQAEEALRQAQKTESLGVLAGGVAHDFNNLLVAMLGQTSLALAKLRPESPARPHVEKAVHAAERAADLTRQMLAYSGRGHFETRPIHLNHLIGENLHLFQASLPKNVTWRTELAVELPLIQVDPGQMQQVIMNLIINSAQALEGSPGMVTVVTGVQMVAEHSARYEHYTGQKLTPGLYVTLEVHDNGRGMDAAMLPKVFDPFFTTKETGRGLGLAAVLGIVRGHHGGLYVYSELNRGTTFKLLFPVSQEAPGISPGATPSAVPQTRSVALVIDDEEPVREAIADILATVNIEVLMAATGADGVALYRERMADIDLILLDLSMPGMNGEETFQQLRQINPQARVVLSSGYNQVEAMRHFAGKGLAAFLQKPFNSDVLINMVQQHLQPEAAA